MYLEQRVHCVATEYEADCLAMITETKKNAQDVKHLRLGRSAYFFS
jgi:hypothetical protein